MNELTIKPEADIDAYIELRQAFIQKVNTICVEGKDYHVIQGKKSLAKGGAEKIASIFKWAAKFDKDTESLEMLGSPVGLVAFRCTLQNGQVVGEGRGAASLSKNSGDANKTLKMAQKSAFIDAVLRASGLSDFFTQDLEDMAPNDIGQPQDGRPQNKAYFAPSDKQLETIKKNMEEKEITEAMLMDDGFPALKDLTGGASGTASELIGHLFKISKYSTGLKPLSEEDKIVSLFTKDLEECTTPEMYAKVANEIKIAKDNGKLAGVYYEMVLKTAKIIAKQIQDNLPPLETKPRTEAAQAMLKGIEKVKARINPLLS